MTDPMTGMTSAELEEIRQAEQAATPGPWVSDEYGIISSLPAGKKYSERLLTAAEDGSDAQFYEFRDARFVVLARTAVPRLLQEVSRLTAALEAAEHRAEAAAHDMKDIFRDTYPQKFGCICQICKGCENARLRDWCDNFDWRGPQKGASHANDDH
jgi:hypothetical protein